MKILKQNIATTKLQKKEQEVSKLKEKVTSLQAQIVEKDNRIGRIEKELAEAKKQAKLASSSTAKSTSAKANENAPVDKPGTIDEQPVLLVDPAGILYQNFKRIIFNRFVLFRISSPPSYWLEVCIFQRLCRHVCALSSQLLLILKTG